MSAIDQFSNFASGNNSPANNAEAITPNNAADLAFVTRAIYVGGGGDISVVMLGGQTVTFAGLAAGTFLPVRVGRVRATGTTATLLVGIR